MSCIWKSPKSRFWIAQFYDHTGTRRNRSTRSLDRRKAERIAEQYEAAYSRRRSARQVREVIEKAHEEMTGEIIVRQNLRSFAATWLGAKRPEVSSATYSFYARAIRKFLDFLGPLVDQDLGEISRDTILSFRNHESAIFAPRTVNHDLKAIRMLFLGAKRDGLITHSPAEDVKTISQRGLPRSRRPFSIDEIKAILSVADPEWRSMILFGLYTGGRLADVASLTWQNIDLEKGELRYMARKTERTIILPVAGALSAHVENLSTPELSDEPLHPRAFATIQRQGKSGNLSNQFAQVLAQAGLRPKQSHRATHGNGRGRGSGQAGLSFHCLRHTAVTLMKEAGVPEAVVMEMVGHESVEMSRHYTRVGQEALMGAARSFPDLLPPPATHSQ